MTQFYNIDNEKLYTLEEVKASYEVRKTFTSVYTEDTFGEYLEHCMTYNNGSLVPFVVEYFYSMEDIEKFVRSLDAFEDGYIWKYDETRYINEKDSHIYEVF